MVFYTTYIRIDLANHEIFLAEVGKGGISSGLSATMPNVIPSRKRMTEMLMWLLV